MGKMEVILRTERRRKWTEHDRKRILAECDEPGATVREVCERYQIAESLIYGWRAERRKKTVAHPEPMSFIDCGVFPPDNTFPSSVPEISTAPVAPKPKRRAVTTAPAHHEMTPPPSGSLPGLIELQLPTGERLTVDSFVNEKALARVLRALRDLR